MSVGGFGVDFALRYDHESEVHTIDRAGNDQALRCVHKRYIWIFSTLSLYYRMAEFVTKTIDNSTHGLTVQSAMKNLGLQE